MTSPSGCMIKHLKTSTHFYSRRFSEPSSLNMKTLLTVVDLFAGVGGFSLGFLKASKAAEKYVFDLRLLVDSDPTATYTFKKNFPQIPFWPKDLSNVQGSDILKLAKLKTGELDFLVGGPPCQGFSPSGKRWLEDNRNRLISRFIDLTHQIRPKCAIIENVPMALSAYEKIYSEEIHKAFKGYVVKVTVLNASEFGVPQIRKRAFIVAMRDDLGISQFEFPKGDYDALDVGNDMHKKANAHQNFVSVGEAIGDLPRLKAGQSVDGEAYATTPESKYQEDRRKG